MCVYSYNKMAGMGSIWFDNEFFDTTVHPSGLTMSSLTQLSILLVWSRLVSGISDTSGVVTACCNVDPKQYIS